MDSGPGPTGLPAAETMLGWIAEITAQGLRRPAYPADRWVETWAADRFRSLGLADVRLEPVDVPYWEPVRAELLVEPGGHRFEGFPLPHAAAGTVEAELSRFTDPSPEPAGPGAEPAFPPGGLAVHEIEFVRLPQTTARTAATAHHDPDGEFDTLVHVLPFPAALDKMADPAIAAGAAGYVGLLTGLGWETRDYYVPYDAIKRPVPGLWLSGADGRALLALLAERPRTGRITVETVTRPEVSHNVVGVLPGASDEWVVIASHHDAPWASAVEDGSGIAMVLAQAAHWASVPAADRPHNLLFLLTAGHMVHGAGTRAFVAEHAAFLDRVVLEIHLEHAARACEAVDGRLVPTGDPEVRWWFTSRAPVLEKTVSTALAVHDLRRSLVLPPDVFGADPPTDGALFHAAGVPLVHFLSAPRYLFDACDTLAMVHGPSLEPISRAVVDIVASTAGTTAAALRAAVPARRPPGDA